MKKTPIRKHVRFQAQAACAALALAAAGLLLSAAPAAHARSKAEAAGAADPSAAPAPRKKPRHGGGVRIKQPATSGSQETAAQRDRRLQRECKGLPNAGACLGYARP